MEAGGFDGAEGEEEEVLEDDGLRGEEGGGVRVGVGVAHVPQAAAVVGGAVETGQERREGGVGGGRGFFDSRPGQVDVEEEEEYAEADD